MVITLPYCLRDQDITLTLLDWIKELGGAKNHQLLLCHDARCPADIVAGILERAQASFGSVQTIVAKAEIDGWPEGANYMFRTITATLANQTPCPRYFFWMEPDAIPLKSGWMDLLEAEFIKANKPFMGDRVEVENIPLHMSGIGMYPNPLHQFAGEAYRAVDEAWDMSGREQIVPQAHFTELIEHAWKHPSFTDPGELETQISKETVLFHSSKDGSLIKLLRDKKNLNAVPVLADAATTTRSRTAATSTEGRIVEQGEAREGTLTSQVHSDSRGGVQTDIFIRTYPQDYPWLEYCLKSIQKYCSGFRKIWIVSPKENPASAFFDPKFIEWKVLNEETEDGYLSQQIHKLYADVITNYQADYILFMDSDTLFTKPVTPETFFAKPDWKDEAATPFDKKIIWYYTPYDHTEVPWKPITEKFMNKEVKHEFMRRHPFVVPRWLFPRFREYCYTTHGMILSEYIRMQPNREFSEFNALGAFAYEKYRDKFEWVNTLTTEPQPPVVRQFFSWDGISPEVKTEMQQILGNGTASVSVTSNPTSAITTEAPVPPQTVPADILGITSGLKANGTPSDHIRWLKNYVAEKPSRRQNVMLQLAKAGLQPKWKKRK